MRPQFFLAEIWTGFRRNATLTIAMIVNVAIAIGLIGNAMLVGQESNLIRNYFYGNLHVTVFLCGQSTTPHCPQPTTDAQRQQLLDDLTHMPQIQGVPVYETSEQSYERFKQYFQNQPTLLALTKPDTLPPTFRLQLRNPNDLAVVASALNGRPGVDQITDFSKFIAGPLAFLGKLQTFAWGIGLVGLLAGILLVLNSTLVAAHSRRRELGIMRLVGAPNLYIWLPFVVQSAIAALIGCGLAIVGLFLEASRVLNSLKIALPIVGSDQIVETIWVLLVVAVVVSVVTSRLSLIRYLRV
jgi:cell division transport system permease protein